MSVATKDVSSRGHSRGISPSFVESKRGDSSLSLRLTNSHWTSTEAAAQNGQAHPYECWSSLMQFAAIGTARIIRAYLAMWDFGSSLLTEMLVLPSTKIGAMIARGWPGPSTAPLRSGLPTNLQRSTKDRISPPAGAHSRMTGWHLPRSDRRSESPGDPGRWIAVRRR